MQNTLEKLRILAEETAEKAYAPYSQCFVGACIKSGDEYFVGCNVENAAYPEGTCAEAGAIAAMIAGGCKEIDEILITGKCIPKPEIVFYPCGGCCQKIKEFSTTDTKVYVASEVEIVAEMEGLKLLPGNFHL